MLYIVWRVRGGSGLSSYNGVVKPYTFIFLKWDIPK
jgi:hypothetical protein